MSNETLKPTTATTPSPAPQTEQAPQVFSIEKMRDQAITMIGQMVENKMITAPQNYKEEMFFTFQILADLPDIDKCQTKDICNELVRKVFRKGLCVTKNHCAMMVINSKKSKTGKALSIRDQYQGLIFIAKRDCGVLRSTPVLRYKNDEFDSDIVDGILIINKHKPNFENQCEIIGGYCVVVYENGIVEPRYYTKDELDKRRAKSQEETVWENRIAVGKVESRFWREWDREMYEKTLINATLKRIIETSPDTIKDDYDEPENDVKQTNRYVNMDITPQEDPLAKKNSVNTETGEIIIPENEQIDL